VIDKTMVHVCATVTVSECKLYARQSQSQTFQMSTMSQLFYDSIMHTASHKSLVSNYTITT